MCAKSIPIQSPIVFEIQQAFWNIWRKNLNFPSIWLPKSKFGVPSTTWKPSVKVQNGNQSTLFVRKRTGRASPRWKSCFWPVFNHLGVIDKEFLLPGQIVNVQLYTEMWSWSLVKRSQSVVAPHRQCAVLYHYVHAGGSSPVKRYSFTSFSSDMAPSEFFLFPHLKA